MKLSDSIIENINNLRDVAIQNLPFQDEVNVSLINDFANQLINDEPTVPQFLKREWYKSPANGGFLEFTNRSGTGITSYPYTEGPAVYDQGGEVEADIYSVSFTGKNWQKKITIKDVPPIFYSKVMADLNFLSKAT